MRTICTFCAESPRFPLSIQLCLQALYSFRSRFVFNDIKNVILN